MSNGRKIFRFLKWIENLKEIYYYIIYDFQITRKRKSIKVHARFHRPPATSNPQKNIRSHLKD